MDAFEIALNLFTLVILIFLLIRCANKETTDNDRLFGVYRDLYNYASAIRTEGSILIFKRGSEEMARYLEGKRPGSLTIELLEKYLNLMKEEARKSQLV